MPTNIRPSKGVIGCAFRQAAYELGRQIGDPNIDSQGAELVCEILDRWRVSMPKDLLEVIEKEESELPK
jgi:hypothetical protein